MKPPARLLAQVFECFRAHRRAAGTRLNVQGLSREALNELSALVKDIQHKWHRLGFWLHRLGGGTDGHESSQHGDTR